MDDDEKDRSLEDPTQTIASLKEDIDDICEIKSVFKEKKMIRVRSAIRRVPIPF